MLHFKKTTLAISVGFALGIGFIQTANAYNTITFLNDLAGDRFSSPSDVNDAGQVVGNSRLAYRGLSLPDVPSAVIWNGTTPTILSGLDSKYVRAFSINNLGQVSGVGSDPTTGSQRILLWNDSQQPLYLENSTTSGGINNKGQVVGTSKFGRNENAILWNSNTHFDVQTLSSLRTIGIDINDAGQAVGVSGNQSYLWDGTSTIKLDGLNGVTKEGSVVSSINNLGQVVGTSPWVYNTDRDNTSQAILWDGTIPKVLHGLSSKIPHLSGKNSFAEDINDNGIVVGYSMNDANINQAVMWSGTSVINLNSLIDPSLGVTLLHANAINNNDLIVGLASNSLGKYFAYKLSVDNMQLSPAVGFAAPIPEPSTYAMLLAGMGMIGWTARRRKTNVQLN